MLKSVNNLNHNEHLNRKKVWIVTLSSFLFGFVSSILSYNVSFYFQAVLKNNNVSVYYLFIDVAIFVLLFNLHKIINKIGQSNALFVFLIAKIIFAIILINLPVTFIGSILLVLYLIVGNIARVNLDVLLETFSVDRMSGRIRGLFLAIFSLGFILGPKLAMSIKVVHGFYGIFITVLAIDLLIFVVDLIWLRGVKGNDERRLSARQIIHAFFRHKNLKRIYYIAFLVDFFYATMIIYTPIYLNSIGFSDADLGNMFTFMLLPFLLLQYPVGRLADKYLGEKELIIFSLLITGFSVAYIYFLDSSSVYVWGAALLMTRVGISMLEVLRDSYFYKRICGNDVAKIDLFRTSMATAYIAFALISVVVLQYYPVKTVFLILFVALFTGLWPAFRLLDNKAECEIGK
ncbi:MFS transporter [Candidatus Parcubacteria bacterium]|nr:MFS transporter [Patescibacteria group bacterium]MBU4309901.1 MFS transporter [Patescibacteria group bacterium]MBU4431909.1 MFS transporter [Patescibacteria group bacterium]MBU4578240.1 MFS transporter [Patescibacteria group bacterium]MCG2696776.1 MFS transporter [Candidatus Parcubacteria bacterium]